MFQLNEVEKIERLEDGRFYVSYAPDSQRRFGGREWKRLYEARGDLSVLGIQLMKDQPIVLFDEYWKSRSEALIKLGHTPNVSVKRNTSPFALNLSFAPISPTEPCSKGASHGDPLQALLPGDSRTGQPIIQSVESGVHGNSRPETGLALGVHDAARTRVQILRG